ncbi:5-formyltetrahydrofolate cyclo-ligase [Atopobium fossor]|uniref:5-formyltetrahydrofolate cyclo-ligase n=1 Tax=Atopobium fossor TaxID=39487 RepID=UPI0004247AF5|nr:5-formyltetrahydrofolate cyclo-ligase [Atopobium fossor]
MNERTSFIPMCKKSLRTQAHERRSSFLAADRMQEDAAITAQVLALPEWQQAQTVFAYVSLPEEVSTVALIEAAWNQGKDVVFPRMDPQTKRLLWYIIAPQSNYVQLAAVDEFASIGFERSAFGVWEPMISPTAQIHVGQGYPQVPGARPIQGHAAYNSVTEPSQLALIPGLVYDHMGFRLGYGAGCYDRFLSIFPGFSVGVVHSPNFIDNLDSEHCLTNRDLPVRCVVCNKHVIRP